MEQERETRGSLSDRSKGEAPHPPPPPPAACFLDHSLQKPTSASKMIELALPSSAADGLPRPSRRTPSSATPHFTAGSNARTAARGSCDALLHRDTAILAVLPAVTVAGLRDVPRRGRRTLPRRGRRTPGEPAQPQYLGRIAPSRRSAPRRASAHPSSWDFEWFTARRGGRGGPSVADDGNADRFDHPSSSMQK